ncbi:MAG: DinB family protein [Phycisphaeraceae bacterium]|nr:MAG: DinB family protein [Phycisphaeraceae bacterium]
MNLGALIERIARYPAVLRASALSVSADEARWKPGPEHWSILEVCCHMLDEEREDFRVRLRSTLEDASRAWAPLDLKDVATLRNYNAGDLGRTLDEFEQERGDSVAWLRSLRGVDWSIAYVHPKVGPIRVGELLASWAAHDALHLRQISRRLYQLAGRDAPGMSTVYAGEW